MAARDDVKLCSKLLYLKDSTINSKVSNCNRLTHMYAYFNATDHLYREQKIEGFHTNLENVRIKIKKHFEVQ